jgi:hypothetical protein
MRPRVRAELGKPSACRPDDIPTRALDHMKPKAWVTSGPLRLLFASNADGNRLGAYESMAIPEISTEYKIAQWTDVQ